MTVVLEAWFPLIKITLLNALYEGCYEALQLFQEIQPLGYLGSYDTVARYVRRLRFSVGIETQQWYSRQVLPKVIEQKLLSLTPRRAAWLVLRPEESRKQEDEKLIVLLRTQHSDIAEAMELASGFAQLVRQRQPEQLDSWRFAGRLQHSFSFSSFCSKST